MEEIKYHTCSSEELGLSTNSATTSATDSSAFYAPSYKDTEGTLAKYSSQLKCIDNETPLELYGDSETAKSQQLVFQLERCNENERSDCELFEKFRSELSGK